MSRPRSEAAPRPGGAATDTTAALFEGLARRGREPLLEKVTGVLRFDLAHDGETDHWLLTIKKGALAVSHENARADSVFRAEKAVFDGIASGRINAMAAYLRGVLAIEGDPQLLILFQRLLPGPPSTDDPPRTAGSERRQP
jgi:putative sterol carrier protein